ncbi:MAG: glycosyltransferase [Candidatus Omnitrophica bacterium]|nr:glycosyltransferase [Candidatus Omnitrophota bacterium]MDD5660350.1 glycosyltransferase [Candidatus Omnitrophota bacterium]
MYAENMLLKKNKLVFFIPTLSGGGAERVISELSLNLPAWVEQHIVLFENKISYSHKGKIISLGVNLSETKNLFFKLFEIIRRIYRFRKVVVSLNPDAVVSFLQANSINILVRLLLPTRKYKTVISERTAISKIDLIMNGLYGFVNRRVMKFIYRRADIVIAVSEHIKNELMRMFKVSPQRIRVVHNLVDAEKIKGLSQEIPGHPWFSQDIPIIVNMGRLSEQKNQTVLLKVFSEIHKERDCRLLIIGEGVLKDKLIKLSQQLDIGQDVSFLGYQNNPFAYVARSTVFCLSSSFEGFPNALVEAMAVGCPVVAFDCHSGPREILAPSMPPEEDFFGILKADYGMLIESGNVQALAEGIKIILNDKRLREEYCRAGRERVMDFSPVKTVDSYLEACGL